MPNTGSSRSGNLTKGSMNQNVKYRLSKTQSEHTSTALVRMMNIAARKLHGRRKKPIWCGLILYGCVVWRCQIRRSELFIALCWFRWEKGVYCYCYSTNNFLFGCAGEYSHFGNLTQKRKTDWQSYFLHLWSSHCMFRVKIAVIPPHWLTNILNIRMSFHLMSPPKSIYRRPSFVRSCFLVSFGFFFSSSWNARYHISSSRYASTSMWIWSHMNNLFNNL